MESRLSGILGGISSQLFMAIGFIIWDVTWKISGGSAFALNLYKCNLASIGFFIAGLSFNFTIGEEMIDGVEEEHRQSSSWTFESIGYLILSGVIGIFIGDLAWLEALRDLGASKVLMIDTLKPFSAALFGWAIGESVHEAAFSGIILTVLGILAVGLEREWRSSSDQQDMSDEEYQFSSSDEDDGESNDGGGSIANNVEELKWKSDTDTTSTSNSSCGHSIPPITVSPWKRRRGYALAIANVFLDTYSSVLTKQHGGYFTSWAINLIRFGSAGVITICVSTLMRLQDKHQWHLTKNNECNDGDRNAPAWYELPHLDWKGWLKISIGVLFVTFLCPALSSYALFQISLALALTLESISPLFALFLEWIFHGAQKKPTPRAVGGAFLAIGGVVILSIFNEG